MTSVLLTSALFGLAGAGAAQIGASGGSDLHNEAYAAAQAAAGAEAHYDVDASGAVELVEDTKAELENEAEARYDASMETYTDAKAEVREEFNGTHAQDDAQDAQTRAAAESTVRSVDRVEMGHEDEGQKETEAETGVVDASADVSFWTRARAFISGAGETILDVFGQIDRSAPSEGDVKAEANGVLDTEQRLEGELYGAADAVLETEVATPEIDPHVEGDLWASSVTELTTDATGSIGGSIEG